MKFVLEIERYFKGQPPVLDSLWFIALQACPQMQIPSLRTPLAGNPIGWGCQPGTWLSSQAWYPELGTYFTLVTLLRTLAVPPSWEYSQESVNQLWSLVVKKIKDIVHL